MNKMREAGALSEGASRKKYHTVLPGISLKCDIHFFVAVEVAKNYGWQRGAMTLGRNGRDCRGSPHG
ncbi:MAG: hypothetical protein ACRENK_04540 [Gemmatimonadaceae bacterium]